MKKLLSIIVAYLLLSLPAFAVTNLQDDSKVNFSDYIGKGKWTVLEIWRHDCPACRKTIHHIADFDAISENYNAQVIGVSSDGMPKKALAQEFVDNHALEFPNLLSTPIEIDQLIRAYSPQSFIGTPTVMLFTPEGESVGVVVGPVTTEQLSTYFEQQQSAQNTLPDDQ